MLLVPLVFVFGASFFFTLLDQMTLPLVQLRYAVIGGFVLLCSLPLVFALLPPKTSPLVYPPYYPPEIQQTAGWMKPGELMMSDLPWAVAWYGQRQCVWLSLDAQTEFFAINDYLKPVSALFLTPETLDDKFFSEMVRSGGDNSWGHFILLVTVQNQFPKGFPLATPKILQSGFLLTDWKRWDTTQTPAGAP